MTPKGLALVAVGFAPGVTAGWLANREVVQMLVLTSPGRNFWPASHSQRAIASVRRSAISRSSNSTPASPKQQRTSTIAPA